MPTPEELQQDKDFMSASPAEQAKYLHETDPDFHAAKPEDQAAYLAHLTKQPLADAPQSLPKNLGFTPMNMLRNFGEGAKGVVTGAYSLGKDLVQNPNWLIGENSTAKKFLFDLADEQSDKAKQEWKSGNRVSAVGHGLAAALPFAGPWAANLGEQAGSGDVGGAGASAAGTLGTAKLGSMAVKNAPKLRELAKADPDVAALKGLQVSSKSPKTQSTLKDLGKARPYLQGAESQADLQAKIPGAKTETWGPYQKALDIVKNRVVQGPDGPMKVGDLEAERLQISAKQQAWRNMTETERQTALQKGEGIADLNDRYKAVTSALDPALQSTGIDPAAIRDVHGAIKGIERKVSGKSTIAEPLKPYGLGKLRNVQLTKPMTWIGEPMEGIRDIAAGRPLWSGRPTDINIREGFRTGGPKPNFGTPTQPRVAGLLGPGATPMGSAMQPSPGGTPPPPTFAGTRASRLGLMLPEKTGGRIPLREYGYSTPVSQEVGGPGEQPSGVRATQIREPNETRPGKPYYASTAGPQFPGRSVNQIEKIGNEKWTWNGKEWTRLGPPRK